MQLQPVLVDPGQRPGGEPGQRSRLADPSGSRRPGRQRLPQLYGGGGGQVVRIGSGARNARTLASWAAAGVLDGELVEASWVAAAERSR